MATSLMERQGADIRGYKTEASTRAGFCAAYRHDTPQQADADGTRTWITRGANFAVAFSDVAAGARFERDTPDEHMMLVMPGTVATIAAGEETVSVEGNTLVIVPPGHSIIMIQTAGSVLRLFSNRAEDVLALARNAREYADGAPECAPLVAWPDPTYGFKIRVYRMSDYLGGSPMRLFRSSNLMINIFAPSETRRSVKALSPHSHADFEQCTFALKGNFEHHLRYPWTKDRTMWRDDEHVAVDSPSAMIIPAGVVHTSHDVGEGTAWMIDIFAPPRIDFSKTDGFVRNGDEYPLPADA